MHDMPNTRVKILHGPTCVILPAPAAVLTFAAVLASVAVVMAPCVAHAETFANEDFGIEYPDDWHVMQPDSWESARSVTFVSGTADQDASITISLYDGYPVAGMPGDARTVPIERVDLDAVAEIASDAAKRCRMNLDGPCWGFELLDSKITTISYKKAVLVDFGARINDADALTRLMVLPSDSGVWVAKGMVVGGSDAVVQSVMDALSTFEPAGPDPAPQPGAPQEPIRWEPDDPDLMLEKTLQINMIMVGQEWSPLDAARILEELPSHHDPVFTATGDRVGIRYHYDYNFVSDVEHTGELLRIMDENSKGHPVLGSGIFDDFSFWHAVWLERHPHLHGKQYRLVDASAVEEYVHDTIIGSSPDLAREGSSTANLVFLNIEPGETGHMQNYYVPTADRATGKEVDYVGLMGFGSSTGNMFFFDMWALPWVDPDLEDLFHSPSYMGNLHDCRGASCLADIASRHAGSAIYHILTPSFLYPVEFYDSYFLDVLLYLTPGGRVTVTPSVLDHFMNRDEIIREMEYLYPFAEWDVGLSVERRDLRGMSYEFKTQFADVRLERVEFFDRVTTYAYLNSSAIKPYLIEWALQRQNDRLSAASNATWTIPMLIAVDNTDAEVRLDGGAIGIAPGMPDDESLPCCALAVTDAADVWENRIALDNLVLHELGHVMGLHHPFASYEYGEPTYDFYFNWYSSPMTYSFPGGGGACGLLYGWFYESPCGNAAASFTVFERERLGDARLVSLLQKIGEEAGSLPGDAAGAVRANVTEIKKTFAAGDTLSETGALQAALVLYDAVESAAAGAIADADADADDAALPGTTAPPESGGYGYDSQTAGAAAEGGSGDAPAESGTAKPGDGAPAGDAGRAGEPSDDDAAGDATATAGGDVDAAQASKQDALPAWVKGSAGWWAEGLIGDSEFISSIEYMIERGVIVVDIGDPASGDDKGRAIPAWVKGSAGWWAEGLLGDDEFIGSIRYLISAGIIRV